MHELAVWSSLSQVRDVGQLQLSSSEVKYTSSWQGGVLSRVEQAAGQELLVKEKVFSISPAKSAFLEKFLSRANSTILS